jgi:hypothetical protein
LYWNAMAQYGLQAIYNSIKLMLFYFPFFGYISTLKHIEDEKSMRR